MSFQLNPQPHSTVACLHMTSELLGTLGMPPEMQCVSGTGQCWGVCGQGVPV